MIVDDIVNAIATEEGWFNPDPHVLPRLLNNPGDLEYAGQSGAKPHPVPGRKTPFAQWPSPEQGIAGLYRDVWRKVADGMTLREIVYVWAPPNENNTSAYFANVVKWVKIDPDAPVLKLLPPLKNLAHSNQK